MTSDPSCIFCDIVRGTAPAHIVCEDEHSIAILDIAPAAEGHILVIPRTHFRTLIDIDETSAGALMSFATKVASVIDRTLHPDGMTLIQTSDNAGGQSVFHIHLHLVPRWNDDNLIKPWRTLRVPAELLASTRMRLMQEVRNPSP